MEKLIATLTKVEKVVPLLAVSAGVVYFLSNKILSLGIIKNETLSLFLGFILLFFCLVFLVSILTISNDSKKITNEESSNNYNQLKGTGEIINKKSDDNSNIIE